MLDVSGRARVMQTARRGVLPALLTTVCVIVAGCSGGSSGHVLSGHIRVVVSQDTLGNLCYPNSPFTCMDQQVAKRAPCPDQPGDSQIQTGSAVKAKDAKNAIIGVGRLSAPHWSEAAVCVFAFTLKVPDRDFYTVSVEGLNGDTTFQRSELLQQHWTVQLTG